MSNNESIAKAIAHVLEKPSDRPKPQKEVILIMPSTVALIKIPAKATLTYEDQSWESLTQPWVISDLTGNVIARFATNAQAERHIQWKGYELVEVDQQTIAQTELEQYIEVQAEIVAPEPNRQFRAKSIEVIEKHGSEYNEYTVFSPNSNTYYVVRPQHPEIKERCECADCFYRGAKCKHQIAVENVLCPQLAILK